MELASRIFEVRKPILRSWISGNTTFSPRRNRMDGLSRPQVQITHDRCGKNPCNGEWDPDSAGRWPGDSLWRAFRVPFQILNLNQQVPRGLKSAFRILLQTSSNDPFQIPAAPRNCTVPQLPVVH